jgi:dephospho-CoA kinase
LSKIEEGVKMSFVLGITGGIASGKSTVVTLFKEQGFPVVDGDIVAREVVEPDTEGLQALKKVFGSEIIKENGALDRKRLGTIVFQDEEQRNLLNRTLDSFIRKEITKQTEEAKRVSPLVIVDIPLLYEGKYEAMMDQVAVVYVTPEIQLQRLMMRNDFSEKEALERINSQLSLEEKRKRADVIIDNCSSKETTQRPVRDWLKKNKCVS